MKSRARKAEIHAIMLLSAVIAVACESGNVEPAGCDVGDPREHLPSKVKNVRLGMTKAELEAVLGTADYSPIEGQYYFSTEGECRHEGVDEVAGCAVIAEFRKFSPGSDVLTDSLQSCYWGAIGE